MTRIAGDAIRGLWCALTFAGTALAVLSGASAVAQEPGTAQKPESYRTLYLTNSSGQHDVNDIQTDLRNMLPRLKIYYVSTGNAISIRGSAEDIAMAQKIVAEIDRPRKAYRLTYTISDPSGQGNGQHLVLIVTQGAGRTILKQGSRVPIMTGSYGKDAGPNTEIQYLDVGMTIEASLNGDGDRLQLRSKIEQTRVADEKSNVGIQDPVIHQAILDEQSAVLAGKPVLLGSMEVPGSGRKLDVSVVAEAVK
jgi:type II secretory pathway component GspD/PulD (secretin)